MPRASTTSTAKASGKRSKRAGKGAKHKLETPKYEVSQDDWIDPTMPFRWRNPEQLVAADFEKEEAIQHVCRCLSQGGVELQVILYHMVPRIPSRTFASWRSANLEWSQDVDEAFEVGCARDIMKAQAIADGIQPLTYGHTTRAERAKYRADAKRDRLRINNIWKRVEAINRRYKPRNIIEGDKDHPLIPSKYVITPVKPSADAEDTHPARDAEDE